MSYPTIDEIKAELTLQCETVARDYAPGGHVDGGKYWALAHWRGDKKIGSFYVALQGPYKGRWRDEAVGGGGPNGNGGDLLDLICVARNTDIRGAIEEAKRFLGMTEETPEMRKARLERKEKAEKAAAAEARAFEEKMVRRSRQAHATYLEAEPDLEGTPVDHYLRGRAIDLRTLPRTPNVIRYHPNLAYYFADKDTGEVFEGKFPAMVAAIHAGHAPGAHPPQFLGIHKTYLAPQPGGGWGKADLPKAKLIWGRKKGGYIRVWSGLGPRGGKAPPLSRAKEGSRVYLTEGIEDALSVVMLQHRRRVAAAVDLSNLSAIDLPPAISEIVIVADNDPHPEQLAAIDAAVNRFAAQGRRVSVWRNHYGGKDLNDALMAAMEDEEVEDV